MYLGSRGLQRSHWSRRASYLLLGCNVSQNLVTYNIMIEFAYEFATWQGQLVSVPLSVSWVA